MNVKASKTKLVSSTDGFDFLGWHFKVQRNGKFRSTPSEENFKTFRKKVKTIVNCSNYGAETKTEKLAPIVRGWRNYHKYCKMDGSRYSLWFLTHRTFKVFLKEGNMNRYQAEQLVKNAFPAIPYSENAFIKVKGDISPFGGDVIYARRESRMSRETYELNWSAV